MEEEKRERKERINMKGRRRIKDNKKMVMMKKVN